MAVIATLAGFESPFRQPPPTFFTGTSGGTSFVPHVYPVAINGRPYMLDLASNQFTRQFDSRVRDSVDQSAETGESALNPQGLWRRSQSSWHYGAGQQYADGADSENFRFFESKGVNPWVRNRLSLLPETQLARASVNNNLKMATAGSRVYITDGQTVAYTTDYLTFVNVTNTNASSLVDITSDGHNVFFCYADGLIDQTSSTIGTASDFVTGINAGTLAYVKGRFMVGGAGPDKHRIWNITHPPGGSSVNSPNSDLLLSHPNTNFQWVGFAAGQNHIYCAGFAGNRTIVYKTQVKADGTALDVPTVAGELPLGEVVQAIDGYLGYVVIGLTDGFRFCSADDTGNLVIGPKITTGSTVQSFSGVGRYIYFGWNNFDTTSTGIGRMDISVFVSPNQPAYASDLMVNGTVVAPIQGAVTDIHEFTNKPIFCVAGQGFYGQHSTNLTSTGYIRSGIYRWGIPDAKFIPKIDLRCLPLNGTITLAVAGDDGVFTSFDPFITQNVSEKSYDGSEAKVFEVELRITLDRSTVGSHLGPTLTRIMAKAYAAPLRSQIFQVPLLMHHRLMINGREYWQDVDEELRLLRDLVETPRIIQYQENDETFPVVVENVQMFVRQVTQAHNANDFEGTAIVVMRSVR